MDLSIIKEPQTIILLIIILLCVAAYELWTLKNPDSSPNIKHKKFKGGGKTPLLDSFATDFTEKMSSSNPDPVIGRDHEVRRLAQILSRRGKNNAILVGPPGVGKSAIVEGLAQRIVSGDVPPTLVCKRVLSLDVAALISGTKYRGEFEKRATQIVDEISSAGRQIILFIDEIHTIIQSRGSEGSVNFTDILKPALARGDLQMIGATTEAEYDTYIKTDASLERRFQPIEVSEPTESQAVSILNGLQDRYSQYHQVLFTPSALEAAVHLTHLHITGRSLPDKAIDAMDEAGSMVRVDHLERGADILLYEAALRKHPTLAKLWRSVQEVDEDIYNARTKKEQQELIEEREALEAKMEKFGVLVVDHDDIEEVIADWADV